MLLSKDVFSKNNVNRGRQIEWDIAKAISIVAMIVIHVVAYSSIFSDIVFSTPSYIIFFILGLCAPMFMVSMGMGMAYTKKQFSIDFIKRGILLLFAGLLINIMYFLSNYLAGLTLFQSAPSLICNDILQFAGLAFISVGIFKALKLNIKQIFIITLIFSIIGSFVNHIYIHDLHFTQLIGNIVGVNGFNLVSAFPLLNWLIFPVAGLIFGTYLKRCLNKSSLYKNILIPFAIICIIFFALGFTYKFGMFDISGLIFPDRIEFFQSNTIDSFVCIMFSLLTVSICYFLIPIIPKKIMNIISLLSRYILEIYIFQWFVILLVGYFNLYYFNIQSTLVGTIFCIFLIILSIVFAKAWDIIKIKGFISKKRS